LNFYNKESIPPNSCFLCLAGVAFHFDQYVSKLVIVHIEISLQMKLIDFLLPENMYSNNTAYDDMQNSNQNWLI
jgi:hypothetical protein